jgi:glycosyltransferase involved in cell wall biosynthesis
VRILLIHRYFWPDTPPYASMLLTIAKQLAADGLDVEILTTQPSYKSGAATPSNISYNKINKIRVKRISLFKENGRSIFFKLFNMFYFPLRIFLYILFNPKIDSVMCSTAPPVVTGFSSALAAKIIRAKFIYHCMDIHPEIGRISGEFKNTFIYKVLLKLDNWSIKNATHVIVLSDDMKKTFLNRSKNFLLMNDKIKIINNFSLSDEYQPNNIELKQKYKKNKKKFRILFAGNIGRFQMLESFIDAMDFLKDLPEVELVFLGEGAALSGLKSRARDKLGVSIHFFPHQNINTARKIISGSDLGIVSLLPSIYRYALPSKIMTYLAEGCPLLVTVEVESELVKFINRYNVGVTGLPGNPDSIASAIRSIVLDKNRKYSSMSKRCIDVAEIQFSEHIIVKQWSKIYHHLSILQTEKK